VKEGVEKRRVLNFGEHAVPEGASGEKCGGGFVEPKGLAVETPEAEGGGQGENEEKDESIGEARGGHGGREYAKTLGERNGGRRGKFSMEGRGATVVESRPFQNNPAGEEKP